MTMLNPPHPGSILKNKVFSELGISITEAAEQLRVSRVSLQRVVSGQAGISNELAIKLEVWLVGPTANDWRRMQVDYDLWKKKQQFVPDLTKVKHRVALKKCFDVSVNSEVQSPNFHRRDKSEAALMSEIGSRLKYEREENHYSRLKAAELLGISAAELKTYENVTSLSQIPFMVIKKAAGLYGVSVDHLFGMSDDFDASSTASAERTILNHLHHIHSEYLNKELAERCIVEEKQQKQIDVLKGISIEMISSLRAINDVLIKVRRASKKLYLVPKSSALIKQVESGAKLSKDAECKMFRHKLLHKLE